ncbi:hypothetical protein [Chitinimonas koreensis]|uniref:hypothetical protein n=1 Tax=Chitinimonas koreensis TaxID=356302 RepID=UPI000421B53A|nr:hypothetical protein [Chitinimonas koreensis]QNM98077.1 hypothetical protein H9L41_07405 [Chitinimonas koreensis]
MWAAIILILGVIAGVGCLARSVPSCLLCRYRKECRKEGVCLPQDGRSTLPVRLVRD